jgi:hypothetical protein
MATATSIGNMHRSALAASDQLRCALIAGTSFLLPMASDRLAGYEGLLLYHSPERFWRFLVRVLDALSD